ncbi:SLATT domain-containing protein [Pseudomonas putida]|uniref:SLATT domain-containing protein n=1 Tax=Pseudomonas putida TaxID=303 RepID=UPI0018D87F3A|nr:SLATT domain-containing protein [Pseudomonas putida]MBH3412701.1 SLATT domain-containing protein [Pseudomonas putida]
MTTASGDALQPPQPEGTGLSDKGLRAPKDPTQKLLLNMRVTSNCRYRAAIRLGMKNDISFIATTVLSLGLILTPLLQNSGIPLKFTSLIANGMQLFFAVCVLVYSIVSSKAEYGVRSEKLSRCADTLKSLARDLEMEIKNKTISDSSLKVYGEKYSIIVSTSETHNDNDYLISRLHMSRDYEVKGLDRTYYKLKSTIILYSMYVTPISIIILELLFLTDFIGISKIYPDAFRAVSPQ